MIKIRTRIVGNDSARIRQPTRFALFAMSFVAFSVSCEGQSQPVEHQQSTTKVELQQFTDRTGIGTTNDPLQQYVNASSREELVKAHMAWIADLKRRYGGTIDASVFGPDSTPHYVRFSKLMREWNPLGSTIDDLKSIAGEPTREAEDSLEYTFDTGTDAGTYRFTTRRRRIYSLEYIIGE